MANEKRNCNQICRWNDSSDGCIKPYGRNCPMSNTEPDASEWGQVQVANEKRLIDANAFRRRIEAFVATVRYKGINNVPMGYETCNPTEYMRGYERGVMDAYTVAVEQPQVDAV